jgi:hypothetical protein
MVDGLEDALDATGGEGQSPQASHLTAVALFEDVIDAELALRALERGPSTPDQVSLLVRARDVDPGDAADHPGAVARSLMATTLETVGGWLLGLASPVLPQRGTYLVAGPLGAALTGAGGAPPADAPTRMAPLSDPDDPTSVGIVEVLTGFGFTVDEAIYLEHRLAAGAVLLGVTATDPGLLADVRQLFADHDAVHISQGATSDPLATSATDALAAVLRAAGSVATATVIATPLRRLCEQSPAATAAEAIADVCGAAVIDRFGDDAGSLDDVLLADEGDQDGQRPPRYVVVGFGGLLGLGRQHVVVPVDLVDLSTQPVHVAIEREILHHAPRFAGNATLTRRDELAICAYFGVTPYWTEARGERREARE